MFYAPSSSRLPSTGAYANKVTLAFSQPGKPTDHACIESFNGISREECVNMHRFEDVTDARAKLQVWKQEYNEERSHDALEGRTPAECSNQNAKNSSLERSP